MPEHFVRDLADGQAVDSVFEVREVTRRQKKNGEPFLKLQLGDVTGAVEAVAWDAVDEIAAEAAPGTAVRVSGRFCQRPALRRHASPCARLRAAAAGGVRARPTCSRRRRSPTSRCAPTSESLIGTVQQPLPARAAGAAARRPAPRPATRWRAAPAAKVYHQAYRHGLLEHSLSVAQGVSAMASTFPGIDRDVAVTGALLHDIGKIEAYEQTGGAIELSDAGKLQGEIPLGYYRVRRADRGDRRLPARPAPGGAATSCSATTASSSTAARSRRARARPRSCT